VYSILRLVKRLLQYVDVAGVLIRHFLTNRHFIGIKSYKYKFVKAVL
jgi:hypothetical protein